MRKKKKEDFKKGHEKLRKRWRVSEKRTFHSKERSRNRERERERERERGRERERE